MTSYTLHVMPSDHGIRLDKFLASHLPDLSRTRLAALIEENQVRIGSEVLTSASAKVKEGQVIEVSVPPPQDATPLPQDIPLEIIYEDADIVVLNKPAGLVVHPAPGNISGTLVNALLHHCGASLSGINGVKRPGIVHRLDKETSGLLVAAKNDQAHQHLAHQLQSREMKRNYQALIWGTLVPLGGEIEGAIGRDSRNRKRMAVKREGKFAKTLYKTLQVFPSASLVECHLETGRTHQIRVHLTAKGHPLIGDAVYGKMPRTVPLELKTYLQTQWPQGRQALHAKELSFQHPRTQESLHFTTPLPSDFQGLLDYLSTSEKE